LADSRLARWGENPLRHPTAIIPEVQTLMDLLLLVPRDLAAAAGFEFAAPNDVIKFMWQIARNRDLIEDLRPEHMEEARSRLSSDPEIALTCFVTGTMPRDDATRASDPFFRDMYRLTQESESVSPVVLECDRFLRTLVRDQPDLVIRNVDSHMPAISPTLNDGVVNTVRQIVNPGRREEVGEFVVADHADVLGHYDRQDALIGGRPYNAGLFHSGGAFGDDEFFGVYRRVAQAILKTIPGAPPKRKSLSWTWCRSSRCDARQDPRGWKSPTTSPALFGGYPHLLRLQHIFLVLFISDAGRTLEWNWRDDQGSVRHVHHQDVMVSALLGLSQGCAVQFVLACRERLTDRLGVTLVEPTVRLARLTVVLALLSVFVSACRIVIVTACLNQIRAAPITTSAG